MHKKQTMLIIFSWLKHSPLETEECNMANTDNVMQVMQKDTIKYTNRKKMYEIL